MIERLRSWWSKARKTLEVLGIIVVCLLVLTLLVVIALAYVFKVDVAGLRGKTLWDWLQLLIIPLVLTVGGFWFNQIQKNREQNALDQRNKTEQDIAEDNQHEIALQAYIDKMSELLLEKNLRESKPGDEVRNIARARTLTVLPNLDGGRKASVFKFLYESNLIDKNQTIIDLDGADLSRVSLTSYDLRNINLKGVNLSDANLYEVDFHGTDLRDAYLAGAFLYGANLSGANLRGIDLRTFYSIPAKKNVVQPGIKMHVTDLSRADLSGADMTGADLYGTNLHEANLSAANLSRAKVSEEQLKKAKSLKGATMPDGSVNP